MERGRKVALTIALIIWIVLLGFTFYYLFDVYSEVSSPVPVSEVYTHTRVDADGTAFDMDKGDIISTEISGRDYSIKIYEAKNRIAEFVINDFLYFSVAKDQDKKLDLNGDNNFDLQIHVYEITNGVTTLFLKEINEEQGFGSDLTGAVDRFEQNARLQSSFMILLSLIIALILIYFVIRGIIIPKVQDVRRNARKSEMETFNDLFATFKKHKSDGNKAEAKAIYDKLYHLYRYMSTRDKVMTKSKIDEMTKYLK